MGALNARTDYDHAWRHLTSLPCNDHLHIETTQDIMVSETVTRCIMANYVHAPPQSHPYEVRMSTSRGVPYFFHTETQQSTWEPPAGLTQEQLKSLPGAHYLSGDNGKVRASHLLVKHKDSRRPSSWKEVRSSLPNNSRDSVYELWLNVGKHHENERGGH